MTTYKNSYKPSNEVKDLKASLTLPPEEYDHNFCFPVTKLNSDRVELRPFIPSLHAELLYENLLKYPETAEWLPISTATLEDLMSSIEARRSSPASLQYAVYTDQPGSDTPKTDPKDYVFAGTMSCINASVDDMTAEPGFIIIFPPFQRTHVLSHACGTLLHHILDSEEEGGLGLRRCQWFTTTLNTKSQNAGLRLGFKLEGILRNHRVLPKGKKGIRDGRPGDYKPDQMSRDSWLASITWEEWEKGGREHVDKLMARR